MRDVFEDLIHPLLDREGGYVNHPDDRGGPTKFGITQATAHANGYCEAMQDMTQEQAIAIYRHQYWQTPHFDQVADLSILVASELFDTGVNMGPAVAVKFLQRSLNALNRGSQDYPNVAVDGLLGPATLRALKAFLTQRRQASGEQVLLAALNALQGAHYIQLAEKRPANEAFVYGWLKERVA